MLHATYCFFARQVQCGQAQPKMTNLEACAAHFRFSFIFQLVEPFWPFRYHSLLCDPIQHMTAEGIDEKDFYLELELYDVVRKERISSR